MNPQRPPQAKPSKPTKGTRSEPLTMLQMRGLCQELSGLQNPLQREGVYLELEGGVYLGSPQTPVSKA
jgi:hypothetical protein